MQTRLKSLLVLILSSIAVSAIAAPGELTDQPAFLGASVKSNIMINQDSSWSMEFKLQKSKEARELFPVPQVTDWASFQTAVVNSFASYGHPDGDTMLNISCGLLPCGLVYPAYNYYFPSSVDIPIIGEEPSKPRKRELCAGYNVLAYNPNVTYEPWPGCSLSSTNPGIEGCPAAVSKSDVSGHTYFPWNDANADGLYQKGECVGEKQGGWQRRGIIPVYVTEFDTGVKVKDLSSAEETNYRTWYTFYRTRELVTKGALGLAIKDNTQRMGYMTAHEADVKAEIDYLVDESGSDLPYKNQLLSIIYSQLLYFKQGIENMKLGASQILSFQFITGINNFVTGLTEFFNFQSPLRQSLDNSGRYYLGNLANPLAGNYASPILPDTEGGSCQQNYTLMMTEGYWSGGGPNVGNVDSGTNPLIRESDKDPWTNTLADVAMKYYLTDLSPALPDEVPIIQGIDENPAQHMVTFGVTYGVDGYLTSNPADPDVAFDWPSPATWGYNFPEIKQNPGKIDDLRHAAWNSRGKYLSAHRPHELIEALKELLNDINDRTGTASAAAFNSTTLNEDTVAFVSKFSGSSWYGDLLAYDIDPKTGEVSDTPIWSAAEVLSKPASVKNAREILTYNGNSGVAFVHNKLSQLQKDDLAIAAAWHNQGNSDAAVIDFIRGERNAEGRVFRNRHSEKGRLGDIVNSAPVHVKGAASNWPAYIDSGYSAYVKSVRSRRGVIYVGANDGMLHGFDAETGEEVVAYIPHGIASTEADAGMHYLLDKNYEHRYYVDGSPIAADAKINGGWKTVLLSGLGAGGKSIFALDITDPTQLTEANAASTVLWEFTAPDMGFTFAQPKVAKMNDGTWVAIIGNGYNNSADGQSKIFILNLATGALIKKFETGVGSYGASPCVDCNGMSTATTFDIDGNGTADYIYAGDVQGNVWAINVTSKDTSEWVFDSEVTYGDNGQIISYSGGLTEPLFTTDGNAPITTELAAAPLYRQIQENNHYPGILVMFGTGQFLAHGDHRSARTEKFYSVLHSHGQYGLSTATPDDFVQRTITNTTITVDGEPEGARKIEANPGEEYIAYDKDPTERQYGWYVDLPASGERVIHPPKVVGDYVLFNTFYPHSSNACSAGASGYLMAANYRNGLAPDEILDFNRDGVIDEGDKGYAGIEIEDVPAGITPLGNDGVGSTDFDGLDIILMDMMGRQPLRSSWTDVR